MAAEKTMVKLYKETTGRLKGRKIVSRETYDEVINRLLDATKKKKEQA